MFPLFFLLLKYCTYALLGVIYALSLSHNQSPLTADCTPQADTVSVFRLATFVGE